MENSVDALKIAGAVLIFVMALSITISAFTIASQAMNRIFTAKDNEQYVTDINGNYLNFVRFSGGTREVGIDTLIPMLFRAYKENFAIYFYDKDKKPYNIYERYNINYPSGTREKINYLDLEKESHANAISAEEWIKSILKDGGKDKQLGSYKIQQIHSEGLYNALKDKTLIEKMGEYYMDDITDKDDTHRDEVVYNDDDGEIAEVNKTKKRVIAYIIK